MSNLSNSLYTRKLGITKSDLIQAYDTTLEIWATALEQRSRESRGHTRRVVEMSLRLAEKMGMSSEDLEHIRRGALLHDIGNMTVEERILHKQGELTVEEWVSVHMHPYNAFEMLESIEFLRPALDIPYCHHERWDGTGYPRGLNGDRIPLKARVFAVVDVWDALTSDRPYRKAWSKEKALEHIREQAGNQFDPRVVDIFLKLVARQ